MKSKYIFLALFFLLSALPLVSLFHPGLPWTHDGQDHVARMANFYLNLTQGNFIPRWAPNLNWGYGHPILEFLYPLPSYIASVFHFIGFSLVDSAKAVYGLGMVLSLIFMYLWLSQFTSKYASFFGAFLYTYAPYRFIDLYVRGDIGENLAFAFVPIVLFFIYRLYKKDDYRYVIGGSLSLAFLILAHNAIALIFVPFIFFYSVYLVYISKNRKSLAINLSSVIVAGFILSAFFWIPGLLEGKYTLRNIVTKNSYIGRFAYLQQLIYGPWNYGQTGQFTLQLGIFQWISLIVSPIFAWKYFKTKDKKFWLIISLILYTLFAIFIMLPVSNFLWARIMLLQNFQFPWRFLAITVFSTAVLGAFLIDFLPKKYAIYFIALFILVALFISKDYMAPKGYLYKPVSFYTGIYNGTTDTGESSPVWSVRFMLDKPKAHLQVLDGKAQIKEVKRISTKHVYSVKVDKDTYFAENTLYFPGWEINANGVPLNIEFQNENYRGIMTFHLTPGNYIVEVQYTETKLRLLSDIFSGLGLVTLLGFAAFKFVKR